MTYLPWVNVVVSLVLHPVKDQALLLSVVRTEHIRDARTGELLDSTALVGKERN